MTATTPDQSPVDAAVEAAGDGKTVKVSVPKGAGDRITVRAGAEEPVDLAVKDGKVTVKDPRVLRAVLGGVPGAKIAD